MDNTVLMILFFYGANTFRSRRHLRQVIEKFKVDRDPQGLNVARLDCQKSDADRALAEISATPFLAERRLVVLENLLSSKQTELMTSLFAVLKGGRVPAQTVLLFWESLDTFKSKEAKALAKTLGKEKYAQLFAPLTGLKLFEWIRAEVADQSGSIAPDAVQFLARHAGSDTWRLHTLISQLVAYRPTAEIGLPDAQLFLQEKMDDNIFTLVEAIVGKQPKHVFAMIQEQYRQGQEVQYVYTMIVRQFRILLELRDLFEHDERLGSEALAKQLGLHSFVVKKSLPMVRRYNMYDLRSLYEKLLELDVAMKTSRAEPTTLLDVFVARVCAG